MVPGNAPTRLPAMGVPQLLAPASTRHMSSSGGDSVSSSGGSSSSAGGAGQGQAAGEKEIRMSLQDALTKLVGWVRLCRMGRAMHALQRSSVTHRHAESRNKRKQQRQQRHTLPCL
jgi:hypothetical protein